MLDLFRSQRMWSAAPLKTSYDAVIVGAGVQGLATAYYLAKQGVRNVAVLERGNLGCGNSGYQTAIARANYRTAQAIAFYRESLRLYEELAATLGYNVLFSQRGHLTLAHSDSAVPALRVRAEANQTLGVDSRMIGPDELKRLVPAIDISSTPRYPILAALYHPPGGIVRQDAVVWGYARQASRLGAEIHPHTEVTGLGRQNGAVDSVRTNRGEIKTSTVVNAASGRYSAIARMLGLKLPVVSQPVEACATESLQPVLDQVIVSPHLHVCLSQTVRGHIVIGSEADPWASYNLQSELPTLETVAAHSVELFPCLREARVLRQWSGTCDVTPDAGPIIGDVPSVKGFYLNVGCGACGCEGGPVSSKYLAQLIVSGNVPELVRPFSITRFYENSPLREKAEVDWH
jgi:sarcosine oxidase subunit beta